MYTSHECFSETLGGARHPPTSDPQANNVRLECSAPLSNECPPVEETMLLPCVF